MKEQMNDLLFFYDNYSILEKKLKMMTYKIKWMFNVFFKYNMLIINLLRIITDV